MLQHKQLFDYVKINLASSARIRSWSERNLPNGERVGEVTHPETMNYRTLKPQPGGLFCEKIFGPKNNWECYCEKYKGVRYKGITCERCGVELTQANVRRNRIGYVKLASPVTMTSSLFGKAQSRRLSCHTGTQAFSPAMQLGSADTYQRQMP